MLVRTLVRADADLQPGVADDQLLLDGHTALVSGEARHRQPDGRIEERHTVWLFTFEGDLPAQLRVFHSLPEALDYHEARSDSHNRR